MNVIDRFDNFLVRLFHLNKHKPQYISKKATGEQIISVVAGDRFPHQNIIEKYAENTPDLNHTEMKQYGYALGKALAKDLVISFDDSDYKKADIK